MQLEHPGSLLQYLMVRAYLPTYRPTNPATNLSIRQMSFIPDTATRRHLVPPTQINVDFRAACFCHKNVVDIGFVCSICLSSKPSLFPYVFEMRLGRKGAEYK